MVIYEMHSKYMLAYKSKQAFYQLLKQKIRVLTQYIAKY